MVQQMTLDELEDEIRESVHAYVASHTARGEHNAANAAAVLALVLAQVIAATCKDGQRLEEVSTALEAYIYESSVKTWHEMNEAEAKRNRRA
jgi:hypothetical protein